MSTLASGDGYQFDFQRMPRVLGQPLGRALFRSQVEDFQVDEMIDLQPSGEGEHLLLHVRKRDQNTRWVAGLLAKLADIGRNDVGYCGMKDRFAITTQWFSLHLPGRDLEIGELQHDDFEILASHRHHKKLRRGMHQGNRFSIVLRDFKADRALVLERLRQIEEEGVPNYFAEQRFGHQGGNLYEAQRLIAADQLKGNRQGTGIYLSAARSWLFNLVVAHYIEGGPLHDQTGPLWGRGRSNADIDSAKVESGVLAGWQSWCYALEHAGLKQERRNLLLKPQDLRAHWSDNDCLSLHFALPSGCFATALLRELAELFRPNFKAL